MRVTNTFATFELLNLVAQKNAVFSSSSNRNFCDLSSLSTMHKAPIDFGTFELNKWQFLDENFTHLDPIKVNDLAFVSTTTSDENCKYSNIWVQADLHIPQNFIGITLDFGKRFPKKIQVDFYKENILVESKQIDNINETWIYRDSPGGTIDRIKVAFLESYFPFELAYLQEFLFGNIIDFETKDIIAASFQEETDVISKVLPNDTISLTVFSDNDYFSVLRPGGAFAHLQTDQRFQVFETLKDTQKGEFTKYFLGNFYLDTWQSEANQRIKFNLISPLGLLDKTQFKKSRMYLGSANDNAKKVLKEIIMDAGWEENFQIDDSLEGIYLTGYIPVCTHKQAIQHVAFVCSCIVNDTRSKYIVIKPYSNLKQAEISTTNIFEPIKIERKETVTGVNVEVHNFVQKTSLEEVFKGFLKSGNNQQIIFKEPCQNLVVPSGITLLENDVNYAVLNVLSDGEYSIKGYIFEDKSYRISANTGEKSQKQNIVSIEKAMLINPYNCSEMADKLLEFYQRYNLTVEFKFLSNGELTGQNVFFRTIDGKSFSGSFVRQNMDLTGGYRSNCYIIGKQQIEFGPQDIRCSSEIPPSTPDIYAGEAFGLI